MLTVSSLRVSDDHFDAARRAQASLYLVSSDVASPPCRLSLPFTSADVLLQPRPKICAVRPEHVTALRAIPRLDDLHVDVASIAFHEVMSCSEHPLHGDEGASVEDEDEVEEEEEEEDEALAKRLLCLGSPAACPRFLEQRLLPRPVALPVSADTTLRQTLGEARKLCPWPAAVTATREVHFRPSWSTLFGTLAPPSLSDAGDVELLVRAVRLDTHPQLAAPAAKDADVAEEARAFRERMRPRFEVSMALVPPLAARAHSKQLRDDPVLLQLLRPTAAPATPSLEFKSTVQPTPMPSLATAITTASQASAPPASTPDARRTIAARVLAPLSSARQRSERAQQLLSAAFAPLPNPAEQQRLQKQPPPSPPQNGSLASDEQRAHPRKRNLAMAICGDYCGAHSERHVRHAALGGTLRERPKPLDARACTAPRSHDPVQSMLVPRTLHTAAGEALPASSIPRSLLVAHEANVLSHLLTKGDLCAQVRLLRHPDGLAASPHARALLLDATPAAPPLANDTIIGALLRPQRGGASGICGARGGERHGLAQALSGNPSVAAVLGLPPGRLVAFRQSLEPRAENVAPPHAMASGSLAIRLLGDEPICLTDECEILDERMAEAAATPGEDPPPQLPPAITRQPPPPLTSAPMQHLTPPTSAAPSAQHLRSAAPLPSPATVERAAQPAHARAFLATEDVRAPMGSHVLSLHESFAESVDAFLHITHGIVPTAQRYGPASEGGAKEHQRVATTATVLEEPLSSKLLRHAHGSTGLLALLPECLCEHVPLIAAEVIATLAAADGLGVLWLLPEPMIDSAYAFWCEYSKFVGPTRTPAGGAGATASLSIRRLPYVPVAGSEEPPLRAGELGLVPLHSVLDLPAGGPSGGEPPAALVLLTATNPALDECKALGERVVGTPPRCRLVALVCGLPSGGALSLSPLCSALGVRRLLLRCERDPDVLALRATRRSVPFTIPGVLLVAFDRLVEDAKLELCEVLERRPELRPLPFNSRALKQCIEQTNAQRKPGAMSDAEQASFWGLMGVFCARRLIDCAEDADAESFRAFLAQVESKKQVKLTHTFARREALKAVLSQREPLASALEAFEASKHDALRTALSHALRAPAVALAPSSGGAGGAGGPPRHGAVAMGLPSRRPERVVGVCEQFLAQAAARHGASGGALGAFTVQLITAEMSAAQVISLVQRATAMDERLLLVVAAPELEAMLTAQSTTLWHNFAFVIEYDPLPDAQQLGALSHAHLCVVSLRPSDSPVVHDDDDDAADAAMEGRHAAAQGVGATPTAASAAQAQSAGGSALMQMARLLRDAHGRAYDDVLDVSSIVERASNGSGGIVVVGGDSGAGAISSDCRPADALAGSNCIRRRCADAVMIGDDLLRYPRLQALLQRKGIPLVETSVDLPHLILDHEAGVLVLDLDMLRVRGRVAAMVAQCEPAYRSLWLVVLWDEGPRQGEALAATPKTERAASTVDLLAAKTSAAIRTHVRELLVELSASPLKLSVRIARWSSCWPTMQRILQLRAADPLAGPLATSEAMADADQREETQHEMLLAMSGLNPWAARRVLDRYSLRDLLSLSPRLRISHFPWVTERALRTLAFVADSGNAERLDDVDEMVSAKPPLQPQPTPAVAPAYAWPAAAVPIDCVMDGVMDGSGGGEGAWGDFHNAFVNDGFNDLPHGDLDHDLEGNPGREDDFCPTLGGRSDGVYWPARQCSLGVSQQADASGQRTLHWGTGARRSEAEPFISEPHEDVGGWRPGADGVTDGAHAAAAAFATVWAASPPPSGAAGAAPRRAPKHGTGGRGGGRGRRGRR